MGFSLGGLIGGGLGFLVGGPAGAAIGAGFGSAASGGSTKDIITSAGLGYLGGEFIPGLVGGEAAAGTGASLASMGGGQGLMPGAAAGLSEMGGGTGLLYGADAGAGLSALGGMSAMDLGALGGVDYSLAGAGLGGLGLTAPGIDMAGLGAGMGPIDYSLGSATGIGSTGAGSGGMMDMLRRRMAAMGMTPGNLGMVGGGLNMLSGLYGLNAAQQMQAMAGRADPFSTYRPGYAAQLSQLTADPSRITSMPGYRAGLQAVQRSMAAQGYQGSGNMMAAMAKYGGDFYGQEVNRLASLGGANISPQTALMGQGMASDLASRGLASLGYGTRMMAG
jgi:hypothetical protein